MDRSNKLADIATLVSGGHKWSRIIAEIEKCEIRCCNCHRIKTLKDCNSYRFRMYFIGPV